jgi:hypothetical protein
LSDPENFRPEGQVYTDILSRDLWVKEEAKVMQYLATCGNCMHLPVSQDVKSAAWIADAAILIPVHLP